MPFGEEEVESVRAVWRQTERVKIDGARGSAMNSAEVDDQTVVDEHPDIVVARELKDFAAAVSEIRVQLEREVIVVNAPRSIERSKHPSPALFPQVRPE